MASLPVLSFFRLNEWRSAGFLRPMMDEAAPYLRNQTLNDMRNGLREFRAMRDLLTASVNQMMKATNYCGTAKVEGFEQLIQTLQEEVLQ